MPNDFPPQTIPPSQPQQYPPQQQYPSQQPYPPQQQFPPQQIPATNFGNEQNPTPNNNQYPSF